MKQTVKPEHELMTTPLHFLVLAGFWAFLLAAAPSLSVPHVELRRVPEGGIQPQTAVGQDGTVHLVYFKGDPSEGDLFYARSKDIKAKTRGQFGWRAPRMTAKRLTRSAIFGTSRRELVAAAR